METYDLGIVGGGPVGGYIAGRIAEKGFRVSIFEKNKEIGEILNCAGLVTPRVFDLIDINKDKVIQNQIKGANIHSPSDNILTIGGGKVHAFVINRCKFDKALIKNSENKGADIFVNSNVLSAQRIDSKIELRTSKDKDFRCELLIGADGPFSKIRDRFAFPEPIEFLRGIGAEVINTGMDSDFVEIFVGNNIAPGFFAWIIPTNAAGTEARIGLCIDKDAPRSPKYYFNKFLNQKNSLKFLDNTKITKNIGGIVPLGALKKTYQENVMLVGDAAAQVKPTSGGGIYTGILSASHCADIALEALTKKDFSSAVLKKYQKLWYADIGRELSMGMKLRKIYKNLTDKQFDKYVVKFKNPELLKIIAMYGDIDYPSRLIKPLIKKAPTLLRILPSIIKK